MKTKLVDCTGWKITSQEWPKSEYQKKSVAAEKNICSCGVKLLVLLPCIPKVPCCNTGPGDCGKK